MIHFIKEGNYKKIGLNIYRSKGGFVLGWVWYDVRTRELHGWRFRFRLHIKPRFLFSRERHSVIDNYLYERDSVIVERPLLEDHAPYVLAVVRYEAEQKAKDRLNKFMSV